MDSRLKRILESCAAVGIRIVSLGSGEILELSVFVSQYYKQMATDLHKPLQAYPYKNWDGKDVGMCINDIVEREGIKTGCGHYSTYDAWFPNDFPTGIYEYKDGTWFKRTLIEKI